MKEYEIVPEDDLRNHRFDSVFFSIRRKHLTSEFYTQPHIHPFSQIIIVTGGSFKVMINGEESFVKSGDVRIIPEDTIHHFRDIQDIEYLVIAYYKQNLLKSMPLLQNSTGFKNLFVMQPFVEEGKGWSNYMTLDYDGLRYCNELVDSCLSEIEHPQIGIEMVLRSYFCLLIAFLSREYEKDIPSLKGDKLSSLARVVNYIEKNYDQPLRGEDLVRLSNFSTRQFHRVFVDSLHRTPMQYVMDVRIKHACYYLRFSGMNISEVSDRCGFQNQNYFSRKFKDVTGKTPKEFRQEEETRQAKLKKA